jgi:glycosyltransferase involved in cell wall biosynthesis
MTSRHDSPNISVIVPSYNKPEYLPECLRSVQAQTFTDWECIVVNDGSPRGEEIRAAVAAMNDPRFRLVEHEKNRGLAAARNTGVREAKAELVICVDEDDWISEDCLEKLLHRMEGDATDIVCPYGLWVGTKSRVWKCRVVGIPEVLVRQPLLGTGFLMRKAAWEKVGGWDEHSILKCGREDTEWWIRVVVNSIRITVLEEALYLIREPASQTELSQSLSHSIRRNELTHRKYIVKKNKASYRHFPKAKRQILQQACVYEAEWHERHGNLWRASVRRWQAAWYWRGQRGMVRRALKTTLGALIGERRLESILRWKRRMAGAQDAQPAG